MRFKPCLTPDDVLAIAAACKAEGARIGRQGTIAIVDGGGVLLYLERPEHNPVTAVDMAWMKARTAAVRARPSATFEERVKTRPGFLLVPHTLAIEGGIPLIIDGESIGGVGVSGIDNDAEKVAIAGAAWFDQFVKSPQK